MEKSKDLNLWTQKEFETLPWRKSYNEDIGMIDSLVILPTEREHDSGFRCMDFIAIRNNKPICRLSGCSDVIHIGGIGGYNGDYFETENTSIVAWSIDCLRTSGLLRLFCDRKMTVGDALSSFEVFYKI